MLTILATTSSFGGAAPTALSALAEAKLHVVTNPYGRKLTEDEVCALIEQHRPVGLLAGVEPLTRRVFEAAGGNLKAVARVGVGLDNVDVQACTELGIALSRTVGALDEAVAELAIGFMLDVLRHISVMDRGLRSGAFVKHMGGLLADRHVGLIGFGAIGHAVARRLVPFGCRISYVDPNQTDESLATRRTLDELLATCDLLSLHASGTAPILTAERLARVRPGTVIINTARGELINEAALVAGLLSGHLGGAGLDVFACEPYAGPLTTTPCTVLTCHVGSYALGARRRMEMAAVRNLLGCLGYSCLSEER